MTKLANVHQVILRCKRIKQLTNLKIIQQVTYSHRLNTPTIAYEMINTKYIIDELQGKTSKQNNENDRIQGKHDN